MDRMKVLGLVGLAEKIMQETRPLQALIESADNGTLLASSSLPATWESAHGRAATGIKRTTMNMMLRDNVVDHGVEVRCGWELADIYEDDKCVRATFSNGEVVEGSFLIGCDGIKSQTRMALTKARGVQEDLPTFTGLSQVHYPNTRIVHVLTP